MQNKNFLAKGGKIGFFCSHFYAQNYHRSSQILRLKGVDMMIYAVCRGLGLRVHIRPILDKNMYWYERDDDENSDDEEIAAETMQMDVISITDKPRDDTKEPHPVEEKRKIRYTANEAKDDQDETQLKFKKTAKLVGRKFRAFRSCQSVKGDESDIEVRYCS